MSPRTFSPSRLIACWRLIVWMCSAAPLLAGTWTPLVRNAPGSVGLMILLPDGTVMAANSGVSSTWYRLTPDAQGHYVNGTWTTLQAMHSTRLYYSSQVLKDGRVFVAGGEYGTGKSNGETYDPLTNTWKMAPPAGHTFSDSNSEILPDGRVLIALVEGSLKGTMLFDPAANAWTLGPACRGIHNESAWIKLPDDSILQVDRNTTNSERYIPATNQWIADATVPVSLFDPYGLETGAALLLPNGSVFHIGSLGHNATYTPSGSTANGTWTAAVDLPNSTGQPDGPAAMLPNGKILCAVSPIPTSGNHFPSPTTFYEYDYTSNAFAPVSTPSGGTLNHPCYYGTMLVLPDGTVLYADFNSKIYSYQFDGTPVPEGKPAITAITQNADATFHLAGTLLNGITEGSSYGDDNQNNTNYPIVRLTSGGGTAYYARTFGWSSTGVMTGSTPQSTEFMLPAGMPGGTYSVAVIANGIASDPVSLDLAPIIVSLSANATEGAAPVTGTITLPSAPAADTDVTLTSSAVSRATVPATVTVLAGETSAAFQLTIVDDALLNGAQAVTVAAAAAGYQGGSTLFVVKDNESATLSVAGTSGLSASGPYGGAFAPASVAYTLTNTGNVSLNWSAARQGSASWLSLSASSGTLAPGANATVTVSITASANTLGAASYSDTILFENTTNGGGNTSRSASLTISKASPAFSNLTASPTITYGAASVSLSGKIAAPSGAAPPTNSNVSITINGTVVTAATNSTGNFSTSFNTAAIPAGAYPITYSYAGNTNFNAASDAATTLTINKASPAFANLSVSQSVGYGTASVSLSGKIAAGSLGPPTDETVSITINGAAVTPVIGAGGVFSASFDTHALLPGVSTIAYSYAGDANFNAASDSTTALTVTGSPALSVSAVSLAASGPAGGPFSAASASFTVMNSGTAPLAWTVSKSAAWLTLSASGGSLEPNATANVDVTLNAGAIALAPGAYEDTIVFANATNGAGSTVRGASLAVIPAAPAAFALPAFTSGSSCAIAWTAVSGATAYEAQAAAAADFAAPLSTQNVAATLAAFTSLSDGATFYYRARSLAGGVASAWSNVVSSTQDAVAPAVAIATPATNSSTAHTALTLTGTSSDATAGIAALSVNGQPAVSGDGFLHWSVSVPLADGANTLTATATDRAGNTGTASIAATRATSTQGDGLPDAWKLAHGLDPNSNDPIHGPLGDGDHDGFVNLLEYAFDSDPQARDANPVPASLQTNPADGLRYLTLNYRRRIGALDLTYLVELSDDLDSWSSPVGAIEEVRVVPDGGGVTETVTVRIVPAVDTAVRKFAHVRVSVQ